MKSRAIVCLSCCLSAALLLLGTATTAEAKGKGRGSGPIIYVTSQGLFYDSIVTADPLPPYSFSISARRRSSLCSLGT